MNKLTNTLPQSDYCVDLQNASGEALPFSDEQLTQWAIHALAEHKDYAELTLRFVCVEEITQLNHQYRKKNKPTNVLAFPSALPPEVMLEYPFLGDIIICPVVLQQESDEQGKPLNAHWAHIILHGVLHLLGYDHIEEEEAQIMQACEINLLENLGFKNPY